MLKKSIFFAIALLVIGLAVLSAQDMARLQALTTELEQIQARATARGGSFTPQEVQRMNEIQNEMIQAMGSFGGMTQPQQPYNAEQQRQAEQQYNQLQQQQGVGSYIEVELPKEALRKAGLPQPILDHSALP